MIVFENIMSIYNTSGKQAAVVK